jgi:hypothetical protein
MSMQPNFCKTEGIRMDILNLSRLKIYGILESEHDLQIQVEITSPPQSVEKVQRTFRHSIFYMGNHIF